MANLRIIQPRHINRIVDLLALGLTYFLSCLLLSVDGGGSLLLQALLYALTVFAFVSICRRFFAGLHPALTGATRQIVCNATGIILATLVMLVVQEIMLGNGEWVVALLFSSVMAFFVLGTLLPLVHKNISSV